ncbi:MAG TPA: DUF72 domain-containing protein [Gemmatimonadaceae bacterium]
MTLASDAPDARHDPGAAASRDRASVLAPAAEPVRARGGGEIRFGTASWTDPTITRGAVFYPPGVDSPEDRLRYYASRFSLVEVDSTYYALPARRMAELWRERTPAHFTFDVKAHALMTGQPSEVRRLPPELRDELPPSLAEKTRIYGHDLPPELYDEVWRIFLDALEPLRSSGKLGSVLLQYPKWFNPGLASRERILEARERLGDVECAVELRNALWFTARNTEETLRFLGEHDLPFVMVDEPQGFRSSVPPLEAVTSARLVVVRFHGRNAANWEKPGVSVAEKFRYLYDREELAEWVPRIEAAAERARSTHVIMNNCYANYGTTNAAEIAAMVRNAYGADGPRIAG